MRCFQCGNFTIFNLCRVCKEILSNPTINVRSIENFKIYTFYNYSEIKNLIHSKHKIHGRTIFKTLATLSFKPFTDKFESEIIINALPIDDKNTNGYSHTAILAKYLQSKHIKPIFGAIRAKSSVSYSGKDLEFRKKNSRKFEILKKINNPVVLVDDIVTTGLTMLEAKQALEKHGINVLCGIVLADARY